MEGRERDEPTFLTIASPTLPPHEISKYVNYEGLEVGQALRHDKADEVRSLRVDTTCEDGEADGLMN